MANTKLFVIITACLMISICGVSLIHDESDATTVANGTMSVGVNYGNGWVHSGTVSAYNGAIALDRFLTNCQVDEETTGVDHVIDMRQFYYENGSSYPTINYSYGAITSINNLANTNTNTWHVYFKDVNGNWTVASDTLGFYKPFADYDQNHRTANIAVFYGTASDAATEIAKYTPTSVASIISTTDIVGNSNFAVSFYVKVNMTQDVINAMEREEMEISVSGMNITADQLQQGVTITGYGSDFYLALKNVVGTNISGQDVVPYVTDSYGYTQDYSWIDSLFGLRTIQVTGKDTPTDYSDDTWAWWTQYSTYNSATGVGTQSAFVLGMYSTINDASLNQSSYAMVFSIGGM